MPCGWIFTYIIGNWRSTKVAKIMVVHWHLTFLPWGQFCFLMHLYGKNSQNFKRLLLWSLWANFAQISYGASLGWGNERLLKWWWFNDQDGCQNPLKIFSSRTEDAFGAESLLKSSGTGVNQSCWNKGRTSLLPYAFVWEKTFKNLILQNRGCLMAESLHILLGTSVCLQWLCHSGEWTVACGPLVSPTNQFSGINDV